MGTERGNNVVIFSVGNKTGLTMPGAESQMLLVGCCCAAGCTRTAVTGCMQGNCYLRRTLYMPQQTMPSCCCHLSTVQYTSSTVRSVSVAAAVVACFGVVCHRAVLMLVCASTLLVLNCIIGSDDSVCVCVCCATFCLLDWIEIDILVWLPCEL